MSSSVRAWIRGYGAAAAPCTQLLRRPCLSLSRRQVNVESSAPAQTNSVCRQIQNTKSEKVIIFGPEYRFVPTGTRFYATEIQYNTADPDDSRQQAAEASSVTETQPAGLASGSCCGGAEPCPRAKRAYADAHYRSLCLKEAWGRTRPWSIAAHVVNRRLLAFANAQSHPFVAAHVAMPSGEADIAAADRMPGLRRAAVSELQCFSPSALPRPQRLCPTRSQPHKSGAPCHGCGPHPVIPRLRQGGL